MVHAAAAYAAIHQQLAAEMRDVQACFAAEVVSDLPCVNQLVTHVERYRGKMLRPMLVLVSGMAVAGEPWGEHSGSKGGQEAGEGGGRGGGWSEATRRMLVTVAAVVEMVHMATLVHDDILDEAETRRRGATINQLSDNETAVMLGDYLISHAYHLCSSLNRCEISQAIARATNAVCEGEMLQLANRNRWSLDEATYEEIIKRKTASLCAICCELGARLGMGQQGANGGANEEGNEGGRQASGSDRLFAYGMQLGLAFQVVDDLLDITGDSQTVGKTLGRDVQKGKLTLPAIHCLAHADSATRNELLSLLQDHAALDRQVHGLEPAVVEHLRGLLSRTGSLDYAYDRARGMIQMAKANLADLPNRQAVQLLADAADAVITRRS